MGHVQINVVRILWRRILGGDVQFQVVNGNTCPTIFHALVEGFF